MKTPSQKVLQELYGEGTESKTRFEDLAKGYVENFGTEEMEFFTAPGRTEIVGNHTDHNGGKVLAASISMDTIGAAFPNDSSKIEIISKGYRDKIMVDLERLDNIPQNKGTLSLITGMAKAVKEFGYEISGFRAYITTNVIGAAGVSSSASFEMLLCAMIDYFFNDNKMNPTVYAKIGQYAEHHYWEKASGLMDQMACAVGGAILLDFKDEVRYKKVDFDFSKLGYQMVIVNTGKGHGDLSREYSEIPQEMMEVAKCLGCRRLCETTLENLYDCLPQVEEQVKNDRAILRAIHFFEENRRVDEMIAYFGEKEKSKINEIIMESGRSSWELLQNCYPIASYKEQKISLCLTLTQQFIQKTGDGCCRVHGGGFAGVIAAMIPKEVVKEYVTFISRYVGTENVYCINIRKKGAIHLEK